MTTPTTVFLGLGSNLGDRAARLDLAIDGLRASEDITVCQIATPIDTEPVGPEQPYYLNSACRIRTTRSPASLLARCHEIESALGRDRNTEVRWGPRPIDIDILLFGERSINAEGLCIPHPEMHKRLFVLEPLCEIAPDAIHPTLHLRIREIRDALLAKE